jgi:Putative Ig domain
VRPSVHGNSIVPDVLRPALSWFDGGRMEHVSKSGGRVLLAGLVSVLVLTGCGGDSDSSGMSRLNPGGSSPTQSTPLAAGNSAPTIVGSIPQRIEVGKAFDFVPTAKDADQDTLTFSIASKPTWGTFDKGTGRLSGTPTQADVGTHEQIVISVTDGKATASLPTSSITVSKASGAAGPVDVTISWEPPTQNTDGSALVNLGGYKLYYGKGSQNYSKSMSIKSGLTRVVVEDLEPGTWYFSITAVSSSGAESSFSPELSGEIS